VAGTQQLVHGQPADGAAERTQKELGETLARPSEEVAEWSRESHRLLEVALVAFEIALMPLKEQPPKQYTFWFGHVCFESDSDFERVEREVCDAFFLRLKGLVEAQAKRIPGAEKPNWKSADDLLHSVGVQPQVLSDEDRDALSNFCALRNCIAHNDGRVDDDLAKRIPDLCVGTDIWMNQEIVRDWFKLVGRMIEAIGEALTNR
jgi:hypothetical protein